MDLCQLLDKFEAHGVELDPKTEREVLARDWRRKLSELVQAYGNERYTMAAAASESRDYARAESYFMRGFHEMGH